MEVMKHLREEVEKKKDMMHQLKDKAADMVDKERQMVNNIKEEAAYVVETQRKMMNTLKEEAEDMLEKKKQAMQRHIKEEVENKKQAMHDLKDGVEDAAVEVIHALFGRHRRHRLAWSLRSDSTGNPAEIKGDVIDEEEETEGTEVEWPHFNFKVEDLNAKLKDVDIHKVLTAVKGEEFAAKMKDVDIHQLLRDLANGKDVGNLKDKLLLKLPISQKPKEEEGDTSSRGVKERETEEVEEGEEEIIELEFERVAEKIHDHHEYKMYCPNCSNQITKVILRRKIKQRRIPDERETSCQDMFGCLSCFSIFPFWGPSTSQQPPPADHHRPEPDVRIPIPAPENISPDLTPPLIVTEPQSSRSVEILKSVVYGGLMESIASLSVVSSAAASEATTINIVALGLANLVGGLIALAHSLRDLRYGESNETNEQRYKEELGRKEQFSLHAIVAVLSYFVFGIIPPAMYGFTFRASDDRDFKLLAMAAASLVCIVFLAVTKAYVRGENKSMAYFKTVVYYVTSAAAVSAGAYAVGDLVNRLMESLGWFNSAPVGSQLFPETKSLHPSWASY